MAATALTLQTSDSSSNLTPNAKELRALQHFVGTDETRSHLTTVWVYVSKGGSTYLATDGHTLALRRAGTHLKMTCVDIAKLHYNAVDGGAHNSPPGWERVVCAPEGGELASAYGFNPDYIARVGAVERAAGQRAADDYKPRPYETKKAIKVAKEHLRNTACASWIVPSDPMGGWYWKLETATARWEGIIMPRRV